VFDGKGYPSHQRGVSSAPGALLFGIAVALHLGIGKILGRRRADGGLPPAEQIQRPSREREAAGPRLELNELALRNRERGACSTAPWADDRLPSVMRIGHGAAIAVAPPCEGVGLTRGRGKAHSTASRVRSSTPGRARCWRSRKTVPHARGDVTKLPNRPARPARIRRAKTAGAPAVSADRDVGRESRAGPAPLKSE